MIGTIAGTIQTWVNLLAFVLQAFVVSRLFKYIGVRGVLFILPIIALFGYAALAVLPVFGVFRWAKVLENGTDYSINNTTRHALFLPTSRAAKYKAKQDPSGSLFSASPARVFRPDLIDRHHRRNRWRVVG